MRRALRPETTDGSAANCHDSSAQPATDDPQGGYRPYRLRGRVKVLGWLIAAVFTAFIGTVNALPPLKDAWRQRLIPTVGPRRNIRIPGTFACPHFSACIQPDPCRMHLCAL